MIVTAEPLLKQNGSLANINGLYNHQAEDETTSMNYENESALNSFSLISISQQTKLRL